MAREWKPGDIADINGSRVMRGKVRGEQRWVWPDGLTSKDSETAPGARPLVVIDPEDREQVERLAEAYTDRLVNPGVAAVPQMVANRLQNALREFADPKPPKCGARITLDYGEQGSSHSCEEPDGHKGHHSDSGLTWTAVQS